MCKNVLTYVDYISKLVTVVPFSKASGVSADNMEANGKATVPLVSWISAWAKLAQVVIASQHFYNIVVEVLSKTLKIKHDSRRIRSMK